MIDIVKLMDPEIVVPSSQSASSLAFWRRMVSWAEMDLRMGPSTYAAFGSLTIHPPNVYGLSQRDFWTIVGKFASRIIVGKSSRLICERHVLAHYSPKLGDAANGALLLEDLRVTGGAFAVLLGTEPECWAAVEDDCHECEVGALQFVPSPNPGVLASNQALLVRSWFAQELRRDLHRVADYAGEMFPNVVFSSTAWDRIQKLSGESSENVSLLLTHLGVINDYSASIWATELARGDREKAFGARGVSASPEGPRTHKNSSSMAARDFDFDGRTIRCEWHTKLRPHTDRIHFAVEDGVPYVGTITDHLPL